MTVRQVVEDFAALGTLPDEKSSQAEVLRSQERLERIQRPVSDAEAALLVKCFGPDELDQMTRQSKAAGDTAVTWYVAEKDVAAAMTQMAKDAKIQNVKVEWKPFDAKAK
jgi:hypothetical protein